MGDAALGSGAIFTASVLFHIIYAMTRQDWRSMWIAPGEFADILSSLSGSIKALKVSPGKYWLMQKFYHHIVATMSLVAIVTGILMLLKIDSPLWTRDPYVFSGESWGIIYVLHDFSGLCFYSADYDACLFCDTARETLLYAIDD